MTRTAIVTGASGLVGSEAVRYFCEKGFRVIGVDNDMRRVFFGPDASTAHTAVALQEDFPTYTHLLHDIRDAETIMQVFATYNIEISLVVHAAAQPSHDWAARDPLTDFGVNATGTLNLLEATRRHCPEAVFIFTSTNKVYGDLPNFLPLHEEETRWELSEEHPYFDYGIDETLSIDRCMHSVFGASKVAADIMVQEYGRYFGLKTGVFRGGCLTGPNHAGAELHGFLAYLMKCAVTGTPYRIFGYKGKQVRDNIHSADLVEAFYQFFLHPEIGEVYNIGGGRASNCSMMEAIRLCEQISGREMDIELLPDHRRGDHIWWISDSRKFERQCPNWKITKSVKAILEDIHDAHSEQWRSMALRSTRH